MGHQLNPTDKKPRTALRKAKRIGVLLFGSLVLLAGFALLILPGPAFLVIPAGLAILALEFEWPRRWLRKARAFARRDRT
jgi:tellurite resistance protein TerC